MLIKTVRLFNTEWFRQPFSKLEASLRFPHLIKYGLLLFIKRVGVYWFLNGWIIYQFINNLLIAIIIGFLASVVIEFMVLKKWYKKALNNHLKVIDKVKKKTKLKATLSNQELIKNIDTTTNELSKGSMNLGYVGFASWGWELLFQALYPYMVKNHKDVPHHTLMIGFKNKTTEMDVDLWKVANKNKDLNDFLNTYGNRVQDVEISLATLREQPKVIKNLLKLNKKVTNPAFKLKQAKEKREKTLKQVLPNLIIPKQIFLWFLKQTQDNSRLREERRFYCFYGDYYIRQLVFELATRIKIDRKEIFNKSWQELKNEIN